MTEQPWLRLDPRMLLVHPVKELVRFLPALVGLVVAGGVAGNPLWSLLGVAIPVGLGLVRYLTTDYRITEARVELRRGLLHRHTLTTQLDRVRTVDVTATPVHRLLGLATVVIGTGSTATDADERLELDGLPRDAASELRGRLLGGPGAVGRGAEAGPAPGPVAAFEPRWLWYAPFTAGILVAAGAMVGAAAQLMDWLDLWDDLGDEQVPAPTGALVVGVLLGLVVLAAVLAVVGYLVINGNFALSRDPGTWHVRRGLLTTRETSIDEARLAGVTRGESAALRLARGARLTAIVTGLTSSDDNSSVLVPPAPRATVARAAAAVLGTAEPLRAALRSHGTAAVRRRYTRALLGSAPAILAPAVAVGLGAPAPLLVVSLVAIAVALPIAADRARSLGHGLVDGFVVTRSGSLTRGRDALATGHVIGWTLRDSWFQRRAGLVTVEATTAGGRGRIGVPDVPVADAVVLADAAVPGLVTPFLRPPD